MAQGTSPIGGPVKILSAVVGTFLVFVGVVSANSDDPGLQLWWLIVAIGGLFFLPLFSTPARPGERLFVEEQARASRNVQRWVSGISFFGAFATQLIHRLLFPGSGPITEHPILGPLMIVFLVMFFIGAFVRFYAVYLDTKAESAV